jgi:hypothetical protein
VRRNADTPSLIYTGVRIPEQTWYFSLTPRAQTGPEIQPASVLMTKGTPSLVVKRPGLKIYHPLPSNVEVKDKDCCTSTNSHAFRARKAIGAPGAKCEDNLGEMQTRSRRSGDVIFYVPSWELSVQLTVSHFTGSKPSVTKVVKWEAWSGVTQSVPPFCRALKVVFFFFLH